MNDLVVQVDVVERMRGDLARVRREFEDANQNSHTAADAVGHPGLAERVRGFAHNWDNRCRDLVEQIETIESQLGILQEQFHSTDRELASGLRGAS